MTDVPQVWHYGLVARWWAEFNTDGPEIDFFRTKIERFGQPALDIACGAGRLLIPYLHAGLDVDACDISADMLALCRQRAQAEGLPAQLYHQAAHELDLPRRYRTIVFCGGFGLGGVREHDQEALKRFHAHLEPGGALILDMDLAYKAESAWRFWLPDDRRELPLPWPDSGERKLAANGDEIELRGRLAAFDPLEQVATRELQAFLWRDGELIEREEHVLLERLYFKNEVVAMLRLAGFDHVDVLGEYTDEPATADDSIVVFVARK